MFLSCESAKILKLGLTYEIQQKRLVWGLSLTLKENAGRFPNPGTKSIRTGDSKKAQEFPVLFAGDPYGTRTHVTTVKGWCLNRLTNGPSM